MNPGNPNMPTFRDIGPTAEGITKLVAAAGFLALSTAFLYDFTYWLWIDRRILTYLVVADHIQTAVYAFAIIVFAIGGVLFCTWLLALGLPKLTRGNAKREKWMERAIELGAAVLGSLALSFDNNTAVQILIGVVWLSLLFRRLFMPGVSLWSRVMIGLIAWLVMTALVASSDAAAAMRSTEAPDIIQVDPGKQSPMWSYELRGHLVRLIERGAVIRILDGRIVFVPKDHLLRIDQGVPKGNSAAAS